MLRLPQLVIALIVEALSFSLGGFSLISSGFSSLALVASASVASAMEAALVLVVSQPILHVVVKLSRRVCAILHMVVQLSRGV